MAHSAIKALEAELEAELAEALGAAEAAGAVPTEWMFDDVYADTPEFLLEQRALLEPS